jgi:hypothetical protein
MVSVTHLLILLETLRVLQACSNCQVCTPDLRTPFTGMQKAMMSTTNIVEVCKNTGRSIAARSTQSNNFQDLYKYLSSLSL